MQKKHWKLSPNLCKNLPPMSAPSEKTFQRRLGSWSYRNWNEDFSWRKPGVGFPPHLFCRYHVTAVRRPTGRTGVSSRQPASDTILNRGRVIMTDVTDHITWLHPKDFQKTRHLSPTEFDGWPPEKYGALSLKYRLPRPWPQKKGGRRNIGNWPSGHWRVLWNSAAATLNTQKRLKKIFGDNLG